MNIVYVSCVILMDTQGKVLLNQRMPGQLCEGLWEFPGGKIEVGEKPTEAAIREMKEEVGVEIEAADLEPFTFVTNDFPEVDRHAVAMLFLCKKWQGEPYGAEGQNVKWESVEKLSNMLDELLPNSHLIVERLEEHSK